MLCYFQYKVTKQIKTLAGLNCIPIRTTNHPTTATTFWQSIERLNKSKAMSKGHKRVKYKILTERGEKQLVYIIYIYIYPRFLIRPFRNGA